MKRTCRMFSTFLPCQIIFILICQTLCYESTEKDLECFNDYETEMKCSFGSDDLESCSGYKLSISHSVVDRFNKYICVFESNHHSCECKIKVQGFVATETFSTTLLEGTQVLLSKTFMTEDFIKPKAPVLSVEKTENGNFYVKWDDKYEDEGIFAESLKLHLTYKTDRGHETTSEEVSNIQGFFEIVGRNLQPNTNYILTARMSTDYNDHEILSDQSAPVEFTSSSSPNEAVKIVVPLLCLGLILIICAIFFCVLRMKTNWWDKISKPKIEAYIDEQKGHILPPSIMNFSPIHVEITKLDRNEEKKLFPAGLEDINNEKSSHRIESAEDDYGEAVFGSGNDKEICSPINISRLEHALDEDFKSIFFTKKTPSKKDTMMVVESVGSNSSKEHNHEKRDSGNCSGSSIFSNMTYLESATGDSSFLSCDQCYQSDKSDALSSSMSADITNSPFNSPTKVALEDEYQCFNTVVNQGNDPDADVCLNHSNDADADEEFNVKNLITSKNPLYPSLLLHDESVKPSDEGYQAFESLTKSTEGQWNTEQALNECGALKFPKDHTLSDQQSLWASSLHCSSIIEIDTSYQSV